MHNTVFFNAKSWDSHPYASPKGHGTTPSEKYHRWSNTRPLEAAMRLTALRFPPNDISRHPKNSGHLKTTPKPPNGSCPQFPCDCKPTPANTRKCGSARPRDAPYGAATQAPYRLAYFNPLLELNTPNAHTCKNHMFSNTSTNKLFPQVTPRTDTHRPTGTSRVRRYGSGMRPPDGKGTKRAIPAPQGTHIPACSHPLHEQTTLSARTCINHMFPDSATYKPPHKVSPLTDTKQLSGTRHTRKPESEMRHRAARRPGALPQSHIDRQRISPSAINQAKTRGHAETKRKGERDTGKRPGDGGLQVARTAPC